MVQLEQNLLDIIDKISSSSNAKMNFHNNQMWAD